MDRQLDYTLMLAILLILILIAHRLGYFYILLRTLRVVRIDTVRRTVDGCGESCGGYMCFWLSVGMSVCLSVLSVSVCLVCLYVCLSVCVFVLDGP